MDSSEVQRLLRELAGREPPGGMLSVYLDIDPGDRGEGWRIALRDQLKQAVERAEPRAAREAAREAADRVLARFANDAPPPAGRGHVGFIGVGDETEEWQDLQVDFPATEIVYAARPYLRPLVKVLDENPRVGVAVISSERVRAFEWSLLGIEQLGDWELEIFSRDWRERKAERVADPGRGTHTTSAGRDQYDQRLEHNRERFLGEVGRSFAAEKGDRPWRYLVIFGEEGQAKHLLAGMGQNALPMKTVASDLIGAEASVIASRAAVAVDQLNRDRERRLIEQISEEIGGGPGVALGAQEVLESLEQGRVRHLVFDSERDYEGEPLDAEAVAVPDPDGLPASELMVELAVKTGADVTPVEGDAARALDAHGGAAGLLRY